MTKVLFKVGTKSEYESLGSRDNSTLYFLSDSHQIMKGDSDFTSSVILVESLPNSGQIQGKLYIAGTTGSIWTGSSWKTVFSEPVIPAIVDDLTTGGSDKTLSAEQGKVLKGQLDTHVDKLAGTDAGHVKSGADVEISNGLITVKKINGEAWETIKAGIDAEIAKKADLAGATFTGDVKLTAVPEGDTSAVSKKYVDDEISSKIAANDSMRFKGTIGTGGTVTALPTSNVRIGDTYRVITAGTYAGAKCEIGDMIIALANKTSGSTDDNWTVVQANIDGAVVGPASATDSTVVLFDGATGKQIKGSTITLDQLTNAVNKAHEHTNKTQLDTYNKTQSELLSAAEATAQGLVNSHAEVAGTAETAGHLKLGTTAGTAAEGNHNHNITSLADVLLSGENAPTDGQFLYWDAAAGKWKARTFTVDISGKLDKVSTGKADEIITANADGTVKTSGKKVGANILSSTPNADTLATEVAVKAYADSIETVWETIA